MSCYIEPSCQLTSTYAGGGGGGGRVVDLQLLCKNRLDFIWNFCKWKQDDYFIILYFFSKIEQYIFFLNFCR